MRGLATLSTTFIAISALLLASCGVEPQVRQNTKDELGKLKGPETSMMDATLKEQAEQAQAAGNYKQAAENYRQLFDKSPDNKDYALSFAEALRRAGDYSASLQVTDALLKKDSTNASAIENKGLCQMATGEFAEAGDTLGAVMKQDPKRWRTLNGIGILFAMKGKYDPAMAYFQEALNVSTDNPSVLNNAALTYAIDRKFDRSYEAFARASRHVQPDSPDAKHLDLNLALVYAVDGKLDDAERVAAPHLSKEALYNNMGFYSYLAKNNDLAKGYLNMALTQSPVYYERAWKNLGALTGDTSASENEQAMPQPMSPSSGQSLPLSMDAIPASGGPAPAGITLDEIPDSRTLHADKLPAPKTDSKTNAEIPAASIPAAPAAVSAESKTDAPKPAAAVNSDADTSATADKPVAKIQAQTVPDTPLPADKPAATTADTKPAGNEENPDIVLLHKPVPATNADWDSSGKPNTAGMLPTSTSVTPPAPASTPAN